MDTSRWQPRSAACVGARPSSAQPGNRLHFRDLLMQRGWACSLGCQSFPCRLSPALTACALQKPLASGAVAMKPEIHPKYFEEAKVHI